MKITLTLAPIKSFIPNIDSLDGDIARQQAKLTDQDFSSD